MAAKIEMGEWLAELQKISAKSVDGVSVRELREASGRDIKWIRERLRDAIASGAATLAGYRIEQAIDGRQSKIPVYLFRRKK